MIYSKIHPQTKDEKDLLRDCDLPFAKSPHTAIVLNRTVIAPTEAIFEQADPKQPSPKRKKN